MAANELSVVKFAYRDFSIDSDKKWSAKCRHCGEKKVETRGTSNGFTKHLERRHAAVLEKYKKSKGRHILCILEINLIEFCRNEICSL